MTALANEAKNLKLNPRKAETIRERIRTKKVEVKSLLQDVSMTLQEVGKQLKTEQSHLQHEISHQKNAISEVFDFSDAVKGFDVRDLESPLDQIDVYKDFLGEDEFRRVHETYSKTIQTLDLVYQTELERIKLPDQLQEDLELRNLQQHLDKFEYIYEICQGKGREQYMQRLHLEFKSLSRVDLDVLDRYVTQRRFAKQKEKAVMREWRKEKQDLKHRTV